MTVDKDVLYGRFQKHVDKNQRLQRMGVAKALDIPWEEDGVNIKTVSGINGWQLMGIVGLVLTAGVLFWKPSVLGTPPPPATTQTAPPMEAQKYRVSFWGEDGEEIKVDRSQGGSE